MEQGCNNGLAALKEQEEDEKDSDDLMYEDVANAEKEAEDYGRIFEERPRVSLLERMRKRKMAEGASEAESMAAGSERHVKTKAMPKPLKLRKEMAEVVQVDDAVEEKKNEGEGKEKRKEEPDLSKVNPRWLLKSSEKSTRSEKETGTRQSGCFFCKGSHRAIKCQEMLDLAKEITGKVPSFDWREKEKRGLWCKWCWYTTKNPSEHTGWGSHTHQRCWYQKQGQENEAKAKAEKERKGSQ